MAADLFTRPDSSGFHISPPMLVTLGVSCILVKGISEIVVTFAAFHLWREFSIKCFKNLSGRPRTALLAAVAGFCAATVATAVASSGLACLVDVYKQGMWSDGESAATISVEAMVACIVGISTSIFMIYITAVHRSDVFKPSTYSMTGFVDKILFETGDGEPAGNLETFSTVVLLALATVVVLTISATIRSSSYAIGTRVWVAIGRKWLQPLFE